MINVILLLYFMHKFLIQQQKKRPKKKLFAITAVSAKKERNVLDVIKQLKPTGKRVRAYKVQH